MPSFQHFEPIVQRLAWTLGHFLWQGLAIAMLLVLTLKLGQVRRSLVRYVFSVIAFVAMSVAPVITFLALSNTRPTADHYSLPMEHPTTVFEISIDGVESHSDEARLPKLAAPSRQHAEAWIVASWLVGVSLFSSRLLCGWIGILRLKRRAIQAPQWLEERTHQIARLMKLSYPPLRLSSNVPDAIAVGFLRPMILLPVAWVTEVPVTMLEAIIAHELAHIRRRDLWVNLFQRIVESLFFYHPAVWWLSHRIRTERELCSDELAIEVLQCPIRYAETLEYVGRLSQSTHPASLAVSIGGPKSILLDRVINVLQRQERSSLDWLAGAIPLVAVGCIWCVMSVLQNERALAKDPIQQSTSPNLPAEVTEPAPKQLADLPDWWDETPETLPAKIPARPTPPNPWADWKDDTAQYNAEVAAMVNGKPLLKGEVLDRYSRYLLEMRQRPSKLPTPADYVNIREMFVQRDLASHIQRKVIIDCLASHLSSDEIDALHRHCEVLFEHEIEKLKRELKVTTQEDLEAELRRRDTSLAATKHSFVTERMAMEGVVRMLPKPAPIEREEIAAYYNSHLEEFAEPATVTWDQIQVFFASAGKRDAAHQRIQLAQQDLQAGVSFADVAKKYSDGRNARTGGRWEKMETGTLKDQQLEKLLFEMPLDTLSQIDEVESEFRLVIVRDRQKAGLASLDGVAVQIQSKLEREKSDRNIKKLFGAMFAEAEIETKYELATKATKD
ncbi:MAG: PpiC-type peptidyl-prolyl cis-trans isomerase [Schlesneria sp.]|nr:PpiC-type peptidyl-prolyl cis-trans isomerase [Schlesneria sp.]